MSLRNMVQGYYGTTDVLEGISPENLAKYSIDNGCVAITMECASLLNQAFMEGFYNANELEVEAALEGFQSVQESSEKMEKIKQGWDNAKKKIAEVFRKIGDFFESFFANISKALTQHTISADKFLKSIPQDVSVFEYTGYKYTNLDTITDLIGNFTTAKTIDEVVNKSKADRQNVEQYGSNKMNELRALLGAKSSDTSYSELAFSYFRNGATGEKDQKTFKNTVAGISGIVQKASKFAQVSSKFGKEQNKNYKTIAKALDRSSKKAETENEAQYWSKLASFARQYSTFSSSVTSAWLTAYKEAMTVWIRAIKKGDASDDGEGEE